MFAAVIDEIVTEHLDEGMQSTVRASEPNETRNGRHYNKLFRLSALCCPEVQKNGGKNVKNANAGKRLI